MGVSGVIVANHGATAMQSDLHMVRTNRKRHF